MTLAERFFERISPEPTSGCWLWNGYVDAGGYGETSFRTRPLRAHRVSWEIHNGPIPTGLCVLHRCDVRCCVNPKHLFLGTLLDNNRDRAQKDRGTRGERVNTSKLTGQQILLIRSQHASGVSRQELAYRFGVSYQMIRYIVLRMNWRRN